MLVSIRPQCGKEGGQLDGGHEATIPCLLFSEHRGFSASLVLGGQPGEVEVEQVEGRVDSSKRGKEENKCSLR